MKGPTNVPWNLAQWRDKVAAQQPTYPDGQALTATEGRLKLVPPLVFEGEISRLRHRLAAVGAGKAFLLQGGDCAESFSDFSEQTIRDNFRVMLQMAIVLTFGLKKPVVKMGRIAGQFAKPRSSNMEKRPEGEFESYRGDIINGFEFNLAARTPNPMRMEQAYSQSAATLNLLRALAQGGFADLSRVHNWNLDFVKNTPQYQPYQALLNRLEEALQFMRAVGLENDSTTQVQGTEFYIGHEALLLAYEEALTRVATLGADEDGRTHYSGSAHFLWIGDRTRQVDGAHVEFLRGVQNPLGIKCGPSLKADELIQLLDLLNPSNLPGRITLITRMGAEKSEQSLPSLIRRVQKEGKSVVWCCDPMHGNTFTAASGYKTRLFARILQETRSFFDVHHAEGTVAGGVHLELTGRNVVECLGGMDDLREEQLSQGKYATLCDPRLNASQALELAFLLSKG